MFACPNCGNETVKVTTKDDVASIKCSNCLLEKKYEKTAIDEPVDIYGKLVDDFYEAREDVKKD